MHSSSGVLLIASLLAASSTYAQSTSLVDAVTQISDGQVQAPTVSTEVSSYENPYTTQTDSLGVVTGQPSPVTSQPLPVTTQPPAVTSQESAATFYSSLPGVPVGLNTTLLSVPSSSISSATSSGNAAAGNLSTSTNTRTATGTRTTTDRETSTQSSTSTSTDGAQSTGAAASLHIAASGLALGVAGSFFALFL